jgi:phosphatidylserine decarboxylase
MKIVQMAGTVARRIVPYIHPGDTFKKGDKIGLIRLGSRVDLYLPAKTIKQHIVMLHQKVKAGETTIATIND